MDQTVLLWILGIQTTVIISLAAALYQHGKECRDYREKEAEKLTEVITVVREIKTEIGDRESGLRGEVHYQRKVLVKLAGKVPGGLEAFD